MAIFPHLAKDIWESNSVALQIYQTASDAVDGSVASVVQFILAEII